MEIYLVIEDWGYDGQNTISVWSSFEEALKGENLQPKYETKWQRYYKKTDNEYEPDYYIQELILNNPSKV